MTLESQHTEGELAAKISTRVVQVLGEYTGRGPTQARAYINRDAITVLLHDTLTKGERRLVSEGHSPVVLQTRSLFQDLMRADLVGAVEELTGRTVTAFTSANHIDPDIAVETFVLESQP